jgi:hypothetical protein
MKKFVFLAHGEMDRTPAGQEAHVQWWASMKDHVIDSGNPLMNGRTVSKDGAVSEVTSKPALGYSIVEAESLDAAIDLLAKCPMDMWVYEAMPM